MPHSTSELLLCRVARAAFAPVKRSANTFGFDSNHLFNAVTATARLTSIVTAGAAVLLRRALHPLTTSMHLVIIVLTNCASCSPAFLHRVDLLE